MDPFIQSQHAQHLPENEDKVMLIGCVIKYMKDKEKRKKNKMIRQMYNLKFESCLKGRDPVVCG